MRTHVARKKFMSFVMTMNSAEHSLETIVNDD
jgi:hypothetical protein